MRSMLTDNPRHKENNRGYYESQTRCITQPSQSAKMFLPNAWDIEVTWALTAPVASRPLLPPSAVDVLRRHIWQ